MLSPGDKVKDYEVIAPLGSGGMAMLYLARRRGVGGFSRLVTLKLVHKHLNDDENIIKLFLDEARISAHIAHPNVVHVEEVGHWGESYFIAMEYVHGVSLAELLARLRERRLRPHPKLCVWLAAQIAEALHAAHEATGESGIALDIVHQDVSPQNVLISHTGHLKLIDFGIANCQAESDQSTSRRAVLGKLRYMSPEQLRVEPADRRTDVYALGVVLWEMLTGRGLLRCHRFDDERDWATRENPPPPSKYAPQSTPALDRCVLKAIAWDASERYDDAFQFRAALLRADPGAVELDAPMVAALMRSMLGDELDRRRANWPSEVAGELEVAQEVTTSHRWSVDELTADYISAVGESGPHEPQPSEGGEDDPTLAAVRSPSHCLAALFDGVSAFTAERPDLPLVPAFPGLPFEAFELANDEPEVAPLPNSRVIALKLALLRLPSVATQAANASLPAARAWVARMWEARSDLARAWTETNWRVRARRLMRPRSRRVAITGSVCLIVGMFLGTRLTPSAAPVIVSRPLRMQIAPPPTAAALPVARDEREASLRLRVPAHLVGEVRADASDSAAAVNESGAREQPVVIEPARSVTLARSDIRGYRRGSRVLKQGKPSSKGSSSRKGAVRVARTVAD
jgi:serine/threonine protein kinase